MTKRVLILGSTGSIGEQALEVVARSRRARGRRARRPAAAGSGSSSRRASTASRDRRPRRRRRARARPRRELEGGRVLAGEEGIRELIADSRAPTSSSTRSSAPPGSARRSSRSPRASTSRSPTRRAWWSAASWSWRWPRRPARRLLPVDSEHSALFQLIRAERAGHGRAPRPDRLRRPVPRPHRPRRRHPRGGARAPDLGDGRADHDRLGDADEQGLRGDRGPPPLRRSLRADRRRRPPAVDRPLAGPPQRRRLARPPRAIPTCGCRSPTRCTTPSAPTSTCRTLDLAEVGELDLRAARPGHLPLPAPGPRGRRGRRDRALRPQRRRRGRGRRLPRRPDRRSRRSPR